MSLQLKDFGDKNQWRYGCSTHSTITDMLWHDFCGFNNRVYGEPNKDLIKLLAFFLGECVFKSTPTPRSVADIYNSPDVKGILAPLDVVLLISWAENNDLIEDIGPALVATEKGEQFVGLVREWANTDEGKQC